MIVNASKWQGWNVNKKWHIFQYASYGIHLSIIWMHNIMKGHKCLSQLPVCYGAFVGLCEFSFISFIIFILFFIQCGTVWVHLYRYMIFTRINCGLLLLHHVQKLSILLWNATVSKWANELIQHFWEYRRRKWKKRSTYE